ncbi:MAG: hypothetical protein M0T84_15100 [Betaproteobacteria bacterium]|nr:hypothetical protein [Betaproteobacteria bacterium]
MKALHEFDRETINRLLEEEGWDQPLPEVRRVRLSAGQQVLFWGLRLYVLVMVIVVVWAFVHGAAG